MEINIIALTGIKMAGGIVVNTTKYWMFAEEWVNRMTLLEDREFQP